MDLIERPGDYRAPFACVRCGTPRVPAVQFEQSVELLIPDRAGNRRMGDGWLTICEPCVREAAAVLGALFPDEVAGMAAERDALRQTVAGLQARVDRAEAEVAAALVLLRATNPEWEDDEEEQVSEVQEPNLQPMVEGLADNPQVLVEGSDEAIPVVERVPASDPWDAP